MDFTEEQIERYSRQIVLKEVGGRGQKKLLDSKITVIGCGGLGSPITYYLTAAGIGSITLVDFDRVDLSNLQRQILHYTSDINKMKTQSACEKLTQLNPDPEFQIINEVLSSHNVKEILHESYFDLNGADYLLTKL